MQKILKIHAKSLEVGMANLKESQGLSGCVRFHRAISRRRCARVQPWKRQQPFFLHSYNRRAPVQLAGHYN